MTSAGVDLVAATRRSLGPVGAFLPHSFTAPTPVDQQREAVGRFERAGYGAAWVNEVPGKDALVQVSVLLAATEHLVLGTGIANIWVRPPQTARGAAAQLAEAYPGRLVLGLGVGYAQQATSVGADFGSPLATMHTYLDRMSTPDPTQLAAPAVPYLRVVGANGPKMLALAAEAADGAMPAMVAPDATAAARRTLGPDKLLVVLVDVGEPRAEPATDAATVREHLDAGADHVVVSVPLGTDVGVGTDRLVALAPTLVG